MSVSPANQSFLAWYLTQLAAYPLQTKAVTSGILSGCQEAAAQKLSGQKKLDKRIFQMAAYGLIISGPLNHLWYEIMAKVFAGKTGPKVKVGQLLFSNLIISPFMNTVYITAMTILAGGRSFAQVRSAVRNGLLSMQKVSWVVSPLSLIFAQNYLPQHTWVPFFNVVIFFLGTYMNTLIKRKRLQAEKEAAERKSS
ncbi:uncharacterized protein BYT42DRAFT_516820 [Radiomyces spectabilis]|uniref:uncharacterized protein n=1 Tax=Radiomyces spectabilis TaxID=64574 RepID=UPI002220D7F5|nr:uncharacterized protein BYT42DRAFT_516820 [Radiomyces spectabilis]KAI8376078.1 hypothetical protein BYT42DRAFT_516820 [Radiomyces spectabilis]